VWKLEKYTHYVCMYAHAYILYKSSSMRINFVLRVLFLSRDLLVTVSSAD